MGLDNALKLENHFQAGRSKITHESSCTRTKVDETDIKGLLKSNYNSLRSLDGASRELRLDNAASPHRRSMPARPPRANVEINEVEKRGSVYRSSREVRRRRKLREGCSNIQQTLTDDAFISFEIIDSIPESSSPIISLETESTSAPFGTTPVKVKSMEVSELSFHDLPEASSKHPETDGDVISERETSYNMPKSFSLKAAISNPEIETFKSSPKSRFSPFRKMFHPIMKSKSMRNPSLVTEKGSGGSSIVDPPSIKRHSSVFRKSLLSDISKEAAKKIDSDDGLIKRERISIPAVSSPVHLHAILKLEHKHGDAALSYEFAVKDPEGVALMANIERADSAFNWVYTFHSCNKRKHSRSPQPIGQMQVSCHMCSDVNAAGLLESSMVTKFILYDIAQGRGSFAQEEGVHCLSTDFGSSPSTSFSLDLHPHLETAAIVIQVPLVTKSIKGTQIFSDSPANGIDQGRDTAFACMKRAHVKVVTCSGTHGVPGVEEASPSSLLDRWRFGGGCDCGGWDMACPILVFDKPHSGDEVDHSGTKRSLQQMVLFVQGKKEKIPALSIVAEGNGQFSVDFHAHLSALQAFSICISTLHSSEATSTLGDNKNINQSLHSSNSLKSLLQDEVRHLIAAVAESEEERKAKPSMNQQTPPSFILDPPFSPMGRV